MSTQAAAPATLPVFRLTVSPRQPSQAGSILKQLPSIGIPAAARIQLKISRLFYFQGDLPTSALETLIALVCDPVTEDCTWQAVAGGGISRSAGQVSPPNLPSTGIEVMLRPGVTDNTASELLLAAHRLGITSLHRAATGERYEFYGPLTQAQLHTIAHTLLVNSTIQRYSLGELQADFGHTHPDPSPVVSIPVRHLSAQALQDLSLARRLALDSVEMAAIQAYFRRQGRDPSDAELETIAQTWSEHCVHKTFKALIAVQSSPSQPGLTSEIADQSTPALIDGLLRTYIKAATDQINAPWVRSAFVDNAGVIEFDDSFDLSFKVETHNHPSAIEPFGGANTGVGGVVRDILGVSHRPIAATDVLCFGPAQLPWQALPQGVIHPQRIRNGVVAGIEDYGNKLGLPTLSGAVLYHSGYTANPLVFCGCVGLGPRSAHPNAPQPGDRILVIGGRTGRDGLRGATFSSLAMDAQTGEVAGSSVQIGDPITEKGVIEVVERARDAGLYHAITDCGAGGLSSAVGEMSARLGAAVDLAAVKLKYTGLAPWEIWLSEAQERMVLAVPPQSVDALADLCRVYRVEWSDIGVFEDSRRLRVFHSGLPGSRSVLDLENEFLHNGLPRMALQAILPPRPHSDPSGSGDQQAERLAGIPSTSVMAQAQHILLMLLSHPNISSKESILRVYDHEVRGATVIRPLVGLCADGPSDGVVLKPLETAGWRGFALANGINPWIGEVDPYAMGISAVDEAVRNAVAVGADPARLALLDNFCWGDPRRPETLGSLVLAAQACRDAALHFRTPFISGKDSLNNEYLGAGGQRRAIPGTLLISSIAIHPDVRQAVTLDLKSTGDPVYLVGDWTAGLAGSHAALVAPGAFAQAPELHRPPGWPRRAAAIYARLHAAILAGLVRAAHDLSEGGLAVAAAEMCLAGRLGLALELGGLHFDPLVALFAETNGCFLVEIAPESAADFESQINASDHAGSNLPCATRLGRVSGSNALEITHQNVLVLETPLSAIVHAFKADQLNGFSDD